MKVLSPALACTPQRLSAWMAWFRGVRLDRLNQLRYRADKLDLTLEQAARLMIASTEEVREEIKARIA